MRFEKVLLVVIPVAMFAFAGCASEVVPDEEPAGEDAAPIVGTCAGSSVGPCADEPINDAVRCATAQGARVLSYYRSPVQQECVRRQNRCRNRCRGSAGFVRPTADCTTSRHTTCGAVDLVNDGAPLTRAQLRACGLAKTTAPHANHYDYVGGAAQRATRDSDSDASPSNGAPATESPIPTSPSPTPPPGSDVTCSSATLGRDVPPGTCIWRNDDLRWYRCDASDPRAWPAVYDDFDVLCTSCPQLNGNACPR